MMSVSSEKGISDVTNGSEESQAEEVISQQVYYAIASVYAVLAVTAFSLNTLILVTFIKERSLRSHSNIIILSIAVGDWLHAILAYPLGVFANVSQSWRIGNASCSWYAFITTFLSFAIMLHHATFAIERAIVINFSFSFSIDKKLKRIIVGLWLFALIWSTFPLFGWSAYAPEGASTLCSIRWQTSDPRDIAYIVCIFFLFFLVPVVTMVTAYCSIYRNVKRMTQNAHDMWGENAAPTLEAVRAESKTARMAFIMSFCFLFAWTPYAVASLYAIIRTSVPVISPLVATLPALFAKSAPCYNPIIYFLLFKKFRSSLRQVLRPILSRVRFFKHGASTPADMELSALTGSERESSTKEDVSQLVQATVAIL